MTAVCNGRNTCTQLGDSGQINGGAKYRAGIFMGRLSLAGHEMEDPRRYPPGNATLLFLTEL